MAHPDLDGLEFVGVLGAGGFADVYAYDQRLPARRVAVKVLRDAAVTGTDAAAFLGEVNAMARLEHPHIVPIHAAGLTPDGHPYLVMPLYPGPVLADGAAARTLGVAEVLRVGVQLGGAIETAHRRGILHCDIKPANVLTDAYGAPALTDFGLAGALGATEPDEAGVSVPWSAPEVLFGTAAPSARSDVYSLAATLWTFLVGHSPFELGPGENRPVELLRRIRASPVPPTGRADVPPALEALLARAMDKDPAARPASAGEFAQGLQGIEPLIGEPPTPLVVGAGGAAASSAGEATRPTRASALLGDPGQRPVNAPEPTTRLPEPARAPRRPAGRQPRTRTLPRRWLAWASGLAALGGVAALAILALWPRPATTDLVISSTRVGGTVAFRWTYPGQRADDSFNVLVADRVVARREPAVEASAVGRVCIRVQVLDAAGAPRGGYSPESCSS